MRNVRVAIMDTGIADEISDDRIKKKIHFYYDYYENKVMIDENATDYNGHGTMCVNTIWSQFSKVDIYVVKILNISGMSNYKIFIEALKYVNTLDVDIVAVCASCISGAASKEVESICKMIFESGKYIIASVENGKETSPIANYESVIGVSGQCISDDKYYFFENEEIQMRCSSEATIIRGKRNVRCVFQGNSRATAVAVGLISKFLYEKQKDISLIDKIRQKKSKYVFVNEKLVFPYENVNYHEFEVDKELYYVESDRLYQQFIYLLCEFFVCESPNLIRRACLLDYDNNRLVRYIEDVLRFIEDRFCVKIENIKIGELQWAYLFYEKYLRMGSKRDGLE